MNGRKECSVSQKTRFPDTDANYYENMAVGLILPLQYAMPMAYPVFKRLELAIEEPPVPTVEEQENDVLGAQQG